MDRRAGRSRAWRISGNVIRARVSTVFRVECAEFPYPLAIKLYDPDVDPPVVAKQAEHVRATYDRMRGSVGLTIPELVAALPEQRALLFEWINEPSAARLLAAAGSNRVERSRIFAAAGAWLSAFHRQPDGVVLPLSVTQLSASIDHLIARRPAKWSLIVPFDVAHRAWRRAIPMFEGAPLRHCKAHGDFNPNNLLHGAERTVGIDLATNTFQPVTSDICRFLIQAEITKHYISRPWTLSPLGIEADDVDAFLRAYGEEAVELDKRLFAFVFLGEVLRRWATIFTRPKGLLHKSRPLKHIRLVRIARLATTAMLGD
jgi:hypothetical protein